MTMEFSVGRASKLSPSQSFKKLEPAGTCWHIHGYVCWAASALLMAFYVPVTGWMLHYFYLTATGKLAGASAEAIGKGFGALLGSPDIMLFWSLIVTALGCMVCAKGLNDGLEDITKKLMLVLLFLLRPVVLAWAVTWVSWLLVNVQFPPPTVTSVVVWVT